MVEQYRNFLTQLESVYGKSEALSALAEGFNTIAAQPVQEGTIGKILGGAALAASTAFAGQGDNAKDYPTDQYTDAYCTSQVVDEPMNLIKSGKYPQYAELVNKIKNEIKQKKPGIREQIAYNLAGQRAMEILAQEQKTERCNAR